MISQFEISSFKYNELAIKRGEWKATQEIYWAIQSYGEDRYTELPTSIIQGMKTSQCFLNFIAEKLNESEDVQELRNSDGDELESPGEIIYEVERVLS